MFLTSSQWRRSKESTPCVGVSEWRCRKLKRERGRTCRRWSEEREDKGKNEKRESGKIGALQGDVVVTHAGVVDGKGGKTRTKEVDNGENWEQWVTTTASKLRQRWWVGIGEGGGRRRWWLRSKNWEHGLRAVLCSWQCHGSILFCWVLRLSPLPLSKALCHHQTMPSLPPPFALEDQLYTHKRMSFLCFT